MTRGQFLALLCNINVVGWAATHNEFFMILTLLYGFLTLIFGVLDDKAKTQHPG